MPEDAANTTSYNPFDLTKVWPKDDYPLIEVGVMELNRNPDNYFAEVEQAAFNPGNVVPGISFSPDKMLQGRLFSYGDAQRYRLGVNHNAIPVNAPRCPFNSYHRDGAMRVDGNGDGTLGYEPNMHASGKNSQISRSRPCRLRAQRIGGTTARTRITIPNHVPCSKPCQTAKNRHYLTIQRQMSGGLIS